MVLRGEAPNTEASTGADLPRGLNLYHPARRVDLLDTGTNVILGLRKAWYEGLREAGESFDGKKDLRDAANPRPRLLEFVFKAGATPLPRFALMLLVDLEFRTGGIGPGYQGDDFRPPIRWRLGQTIELRTLQHVAPK